LRFVLFFMILDVASGFILNQLYFNQKSGKFHRTTYSLAQTEADILLVGTSHTVRHYIPSIFSDSLNKSCYNVGARGQNLFYCAAVVDQILERHQPKQIVMNIDPDLFTEAAMLDKLAALKPYYRSQEAVQPYVEKRGPLEKFKLFSSFYTYNSTLIHILKYSFLPQKDFDGYLPMEGTCKKTFSETDRKLDGPGFKVTEEQMELLEDMVKNITAKNVQLTFVISPILAGDYIHSQQIESLARQYEVPLWNLSLDERFVLKNELFGDQSHLNHQGATLFSSVVSQKLKNDNRL
ncbi:MAG: hypothetical protein AAF206_22875, partial [Bacteroidota bacterium]